MSKSATAVSAGSAAGRSSWDESATVYRGSWIDPRVKYGRVKAASTGTVTLKVVVRGGFAPVRPDDASLAAPRGDPSTPGGAEVPVSSLRAAQFPWPARVT